MRALIRLHVEPRNDLPQSWLDQSEEYYNEVIDLFRKLGYAAQKTYRDPSGLDNDPFVKRIFADVPEEFREQETRHLIMTGYTSDGQAHFVVASINPGELHVRLHALVFGRLRRACEEFYSKVRLFDRATMHFSWSWLSNIPWAFGFIKKGSGSIGPQRLIMKSEVDVMEPNRDHPTIKGHVIGNALRDAVRNNLGEPAVSAICAMVSVWLFFATPSISPALTEFLAHNGAVFEGMYVQGALERVFSAFLVTAFVSTLGLLVRVIEVQRYAPIRWNSFDSPGSA